ncbi:MAG: hypothetical protein JW864_03310 [Spirochaetes bacterium]|nr:hypothetical protein [Spirochaetota bacterium]
MVYVVKLFLISIFLLGWTLNSYSKSEMSGKKVLFGPFIGGSTTNGYYEDELGSGYNFGIFINYSLFNNSRLLFEGNFSYTELSLEKSTASEFSVYSLGAGPVLFIPFSYVQPYFGLFANINYLKLTTVLTKEKEKTLKAGASVKAGLNIPFYEKISANLGVKYSVNELSGELYQETAVYAGVTYSVNFFTVERVQSITRQIEIDEYYEKGFDYFKKGDGLKAKDYFNLVMEYDKSYKDVEHYMGIIRASEENYNKALKFIAGENFFEALPLLVDTEKYLLKASLRLMEVRKQIAAEEKKLETLGIQAYDREDYEQCIFYMKKVQLINPENESVKIYLPRAIQRYNALKKFE